MQPVPARIVSFLADEVRRDGGLGILARIAPVARQMMAGRIAQVSADLEDARRSTDGCTGGFFLKTTADLETELARLEAQAERGNAILSDPHAGEFHSPLARWFAHCFGGDGPPVPLGKAAMATR